MRNIKGLFITFEGPDGSGKSTQINRLYNYLKGLGKECILTREPGGTEIGEKMREILKDNSLNNVISLETEVLLLQVARAQHVHEIIKPALQKGIVVLCDRYSDSSVAYQGVARGVGVKIIKFLNKFSTSGITPDLTILLDIPVKKGLHRSSTRQPERDRWELQKRDFHEKVRKAYLKLARQFPGRIKVVSADNEIEKVHGKIIKIVKKTLKKRFK